MSTDDVDIHLEQLGEKIETANAQRRRLLNCAKATLLFHSGSPWSHAKADEWKEITGKDEATTRVLCDFIREQLEACV
jgi:hypothetical protein